VTDAPEILTENRDSIGWITVNRAHASNAARPETMRALCEALDQLVPDPAVRAIVLTGSGRHFLAGGDFGFLQDIVDGKADPFQTVYRWFQGAARPDRALRPRRSWKSIHRSRVSTRSTTPCARGWAAAGSASPIGR
jgi:enoyl-CoA hydratase/carnithine racemase